jgi:hypothetical protein
MKAKKVLAMLVAAMVAAAMFATPAEAKVQAADMPRCSLPYVMDVNPNGNGYDVLVSCSGNAKKFSMKAKCGKRTLKAERIGKRSWVVKMKRGKTYRLSVRGDGGKWRSIEYRIC